MECQQCGRSFTASRSHAKFCSSACRKAASRGTQSAAARVDEERELKARRAAAAAKLYGGDDEPEPKVVDRYKGVDGKIVGGWRDDA